MQRNPPKRRHQIEGNEVNGEVVCCPHVFGSMCVCVCGGGQVFVSLDRIVCSLSFHVFQEGDESNL